LAETWKRNAPTCETICENQEEEELEGAIVYMLVEQDEDEVAYMISFCPNDIDCWFGDDDISDTRFWISHGRHGA